MKKEQINVSGSKFQRAYGVSDSVTMSLNGSRKTLPISAIMNTWGVNHEDRNKRNIYCSINDVGSGIDFKAKAGNIEINIPFITAFPSIIIRRSFGNCKKEGILNEAFNCRFC